MRLFIVCFVAALGTAATHIVPASAGERIRDGRSEATAIVVPVDNAHRHHWERAYLKKHFPAHFTFDQPLTDFGEEHAFIAHEKEGRYYDYYAFKMRGKQYKVYFDITKQVEEFTREYNKRK